MSSILKALRKLEEEKARRQDGSPDIARDILKRGPRRHQASPWGATVLVSVLVLAVGILAYTRFENRAVSGPPSQPVVTPLASVPVPTTPAPEGAAPASKEKRQQAAPSAKVKKADVAIKRVSPPPAPEPLPAVGKPVEVSLPRLTLSGIAYQDRAEARLAVVNDLPVMEGTLIKGARVEEILRDRVRFSLAGRRFEVSLGADLAGH